MSNHDKFQFFCVFFFIFLFLRAPHPIPVGLPLMFEVSFFFVLCVPCPFCCIYYAARLSQKRYSLHTHLGASLVFPFAPFGTRWPFFFFGGLIGCNQTVRRHSPDSLFQFLPFSAVGAVMIALFPQPSSRHSGGVSLLFSGFALPACLPRVRRHF